MADNIGNDLQAVSASDLVGGTLGLIAGLIIAFLITAFTRYQMVKT